MPLPKISLQFILKTIPFSKSVARYQADILSKPLEILSAKFKISSEKNKSVTLMFTTLSKTPARTYAHTHTRA